jgi:hypothetical protein
MSADHPNYHTIRRNVEQRLSRQKWLYRILFFVVHLIFYAVTMFVVWGTLAANDELWEMLFNTATSAGAVVLLPTILWAMVLLFHVASLYFESRAGEEAIRTQWLMREVGEEMMRKGFVDDTNDEKPKRHHAIESEAARLSDDGELIPLDEDERLEQRIHSAKMRAGSPNDL